MLMNAEGFSDWPIMLHLSTSDGQLVKSQRFLQGNDQSRCRLPVADLRPIGGDWFDLDVGRFTVATEMDLSVEFVLQEIESQWWKHGLVVDCVKIQSSNAISQATP
jgi:hypothetical protein